MKYILWGVGSEKNDIRDYALDKYGKDVMYFVDNAPSKQGIYMCETGGGRCLNVFSPDVLKTEKEEFELIILCMNKTNIRAIQKQIEDMNISLKINLLDDFRRDYLLRNCLRNIEKENFKLKQALVETRLELYKLAGTLIPIEEYAEVSGNDIEDYWTKHTVLDDYFLTAKDSIEYCDTRFSLYPYFKEYAEMENSHDDEIILDYGCGPGNDLVWYLYNNNSLKKIIGIDVSRTALRHARYRLAVMEGGGFK